VFPPVPSAVRVSRLQAGARKRTAAMTACVLFILGSMVARDVLSQRPVM
jgi:hypothetical protein